MAKAVKVGGTPPVPTDIKSSDKKEEQAQISGIPIDEYIKKKRKQRWSVPLGIYFLSFFVLSYKPQCRIRSVYFVEHSNEYFSGKRVE